MPSAGSVSSALFARDECMHATAFTLPKTTSLETYTYTVLLPYGVLTLSSTRRHQMEKGPLLQRNSRFTLQTPHQHRQPLSEALTLAGLLCRALRCRAMPCCTMRSLVRADLLTPLRRCASGLDTPPKVPPDLSKGSNCEKQREKGVIKEDGNRGVLT